MRRGYAVGLAMVLLCTHCADGGRGGSAARAYKRATWSLPTCKQVNVPTSSWTEVTSDDGFITLRLPSSYSRMQGTVPGMWAIPGGTFAYQYGTDPLLRDSIAGDSISPVRGWCLGPLDGAMALVQYGYAGNATTGPGYYLQAFRPLDSLRDLILIGFARDTLRAPALLAIMRSIRIRAKDSGR